VAASWCRIGPAEFGLGDRGAAAVAFRTGLESAVHHEMQALIYYASMGMGLVYGAEGKLDRVLAPHNQHAPRIPTPSLPEWRLTIWHPRSMGSWLFSEPR
jgi:hypothetical protein